MISNIKMIVTDLDRTLLTSEKEVTKFTAEILKLCQEKGIKIVFATARPERVTKRFQKYIIPDFIISDNGAVITRKCEILRSLPISETIKNSLLSAILSEKKITCITAETGFFLYSNYIGPPWDSDWESWNVKYTDFSGEITESIVKISVECAYYEVLENISKMFSEVHIHQNSGENWSQIMRFDSTKLNAITYICELSGIKLSETAAFGDDFNDVEMLKNCGFGVAVENAVKEAKDVAKFICGTNDDDGAAVWINKNLLNVNRF